jgi:hypothetical protein
MLRDMMMGRATGSQAGPVEPTNSGSEARILGT